ncbi:MAG: aminotransferase class I/II-fold pyridoxal phosphate-dependent enzyme [Acidobacteria bacterium ACB2]|nr:aminotransferase class I/II-fold pyridoxal phosphate-dependent enzyme [Acidobacteria bacterium ACB2]
MSSYAEKPADTKCPAARPGPAAAEIRAYSVGPAPPEGVRRLHLNEYRYAHPAGVIAALRGASAEVPAEDLLTNYQSGPDPELADDLARYVGAPSRENILITPGSDEALRAVIDTSALRGHRTVLMGVPGYTHFEHYATLRELAVVTYPIGLATAAADHEAALLYHAGLLSAGCLVYLCSPNNPTGDLWEPDAVARLARECPKSLFLIDEAYVEFASVDGREVPAGASAAEALNMRSLVRVALAFPNVVVTRTLSKAFGLAALRIGYAVGRAPIIASLGIAVSPKAFGPVAACVARAALRELPHYLRTTLAARAGARAVVAELSTRGWWALDTPGNFYLVYVGAPAAVTARLAGLGVQVRNRDDLPGLAGFVRITAGTPEDGAAVLAAFAELTPPPELPPQAFYANKRTVAAVKALMRRTLEALAAAGVTVWAQGGTMLGMFRHRRAQGDGRWRGGMIPWDDDGDLAYLRPPDGSDPLAAHAAAFAERGLTLQRNRTDAYWQVGTNEPGATISPVHIDVFSYSGTPAAGYVLDDPRFAAEDPGSPQAHCNTRYAHDELFPLRHDHTFYDLELAMPAQPEVVLRRALGPDFATTARIRAGDGHLAYALRDTTPA